MSSIHSNIRFNLSQKFAGHFVNDFSRSISLAYLSGISPLFWGPGGYGKTEMINTVLETIQISKGVLECHPSTTVSELFGGATAQTDVFTASPENLRAVQSGNPVSADGTILDRDGMPLYATEITFESINFDAGVLSKRQFFAEEILDAPIRVLAAKKAAMTNKAWGGYASKNHIIIGATNVDPYVLLDEVPVVWRNAIDAYLQRFIIIKHHPGKLTVDSYLELDETPSTPAPKRLVSEKIFDQEVKEAQEVKIPENMRFMLATLSAKSGELGSEVSFRTHQWCKRLMQASAYLDGRDEVYLDDLSVIPLVGSYSKQISKDLQKEIELQEQNLKISVQLDDVAKNLEKIKHFANTSSLSTHMRFSTIAENLGKLADRLSEVSVNDSNSSRKELLMKEILSFQSRSKEKAQEAMVVQNLLD